MSARRPRIVVTLPARTVRGLEREIADGHADGADVVEVRVDRLTDDPDQLASLFAGPVPILATLRSRAEGGEGPNDPGERTRRLLALVAQGCRFLDLEAERDGELIAQWSEAASSGSPEIVVSRHETPSSDGSTDGNRQANRIAWWKRVEAATIARCCSELLPRARADGRARVTWMTTGPSGPILRLRARAHGFPAVYAAPTRASRAGRVEPSQIPVDDLSRYWSSPDDSPWFAVVGAPVAHSDSPRIFEEWFRREDRSALYVALLADSEREVETILNQLPSERLAGVNVTHPWKRFVAARADHRSPTVVASGSANVVSFRSDGAWADNTDASALSRRFDELVSEGRWDGSEAVVVGAGGAAATAVVALVKRGSEVSILARDPAKAHDLIERLSIPDRKPSGSAALVVHATPVGRPEAGTLEVPLRPWLGPRTYVLDLVYGSERSPVEAAAAAARSTYEDGRRLLLYQAEATFRIWFGHDPPAEQAAVAIGGAV